MHYPDKWVVVKLPEDQGYKVLGSWGGSYLYGESWRLNSGITEVHEDDEYFYFKGYSGSEYKCHKEMYGLNMISQDILNQLQDKGAELMPESSNWLNTI